MSAPAKSSASKSQAPPAKESRRESLVDESNQAQKENEEERAEHDIFVLEIRRFVEMSSEEFGQLSNRELRKLHPYLQFMWKKDEDVLTIHNDLVDRWNVLVGLSKSARHDADFFKQKAEDNQARAEEAEKEVHNLRTARASGTPGSESGGMSKSERMPDPDQFDNGDPKEYRIWKRAIRNKMEINFDRYDTDRKQVIYALNRTRGRAAQTLNTYLGHHEDVSLEELFERMDEQFDDPNAVNTARAQYISLRQNEREFADFIGDFRSLAQEAQIPADMMVFDLRGKIRTELKQVAAACEPKNANEFISFLRNADRNLKAAGSYRAKQKKNEDSGPKQEKTEASTPSSSSGQKRNNVSTIRCYSCNKMGHFATSCPESASKNEQPATK